jgi:hypothetical protein
MNKTNETRLVLAENLIQLIFSHAIISHTITLVAWSIHKREHRVESFWTMITFTPLSGAAHSTRTVPLAYLLQVDDVRILLDCGSPDWIPEDTNEPADNSWENYCEALRQSALVFSSYRCIL